jgi:hypothetical protein
MPINASFLSLRITLIVPSLVADCVFFTGPKAELGPPNDGCTEIIKGVIEDITVSIFIQ